MNWLKEKWITIINVTALWLIMLLFIIPWFIVNLTPRSSIFEYYWVTPHKDVYDKMETWNFYSYSYIWDDWLKLHGDEKTECKWVDWVTRNSYFDSSWTTNKKDDKEDFLSWSIEDRPTWAWWGWLINYSSECVMESIITTDYCLLLACDEKKQIIHTEPFYIK